jgi:hypothetical protein
MSSAPEFDLFSTRRILMQSAYTFIYTKGWTREQWENDESVISFAAEHGLHSELPHYSALGAAGFSKGY